VTGPLEPIFLRVDPVEIACIKFLFESYEGAAVVRTMDRRAATIVVLVSRDFLDVARGVLEELQGRAERIDPPADAWDDWLLRVLRDEGP
jgi:hypothetical protein